MAQTANAIGFRNAKIEISNNGSTWTDIGGWANSIKVGAGEREIGEFFTLDGDTPILTPGKRGAIEITTAIAYTEGAGDPYEVVRAAYEGATYVYIRWSPRGGSSGQFQFTTGPGLIGSPIYPGGEAGPGDTVAVEFTIKCQSITKSVVA